MGDEVEAVVSGDDVQYDCTGAKGTKRSQEGLEILNKGILAKK